MVDFQSRDRDRDREDEPSEDDGTAAQPTADESGHADHEHTDHDHDLEGEAESVGVALVTISSTRTIDEDPSGDAIESLLEEAGYEIATRELLGDDLDTIQSAVNSLTDRKDVDAIVTTGGTGVTPDDVTIEAVVPLFSKTLPGFGELFRRLSIEEVGTRAMATRATGGIVEDVPVFNLPGSENAARLGTREIIVPELSHLVALATRE